MLSVFCSDYTYSLSEFVIENFVGPSAPSANFNEDISLIYAQNDFSTFHMIL